MKQKKIFLFILSLMMVIFTLGSCKKECKHKWEDSVITAATCTENGSTEQKCTLCGKTKTLEVLALGHDMQDVNAKPATCTETGYDAYQQCSRCEHNTKGTEIPALNHAFSEEWTKDETNHWHECTRENCTEKAGEGAHTDSDNDHICDTCKEKISNCNDENNDHICDACEEKISECSGGTATCQNKAICSVCGHEYGEKDFNNHIETGKEVWIIKDGKHWKQWDCCETKITDEAEHNFNKTVVDNKYLASSASCTAAAKYYYSCECGEKGTETFSHGDLLEHTFGTWNVGTDETCTEDGVKPHKDCTVCGKHFDENDLEITDIVIEAGHDFNTDSWAADITGHYHSCNREGCAEKSDFGVHNFKDGICDTCDVHNTFGTEGLTYKYNSTTETYSVLAYNGEELDVVIPYFYNDGTNGEHKVTEIGDGAFANGNFSQKQYSNNNNITSVVIPDSINKIGIASFAFCEEITTVVIPNSVTILEDGAFHYCVKLENITISNNLKRANANIFNNTAWYNNQTDELVYIGNYLYRLKGQNSSVDKIVIKEGTVGIFAYALGNSKGFTSVVIPNTVEWIDIYAFYKAAITEINIPASVKNIYRRAFGECRSLTSINIPATVEFVDDYAFTWGKGLTEITIESGKTKFGDGVFSDCGDLNNSETLVVTLPNDMQLINISMFANSAIKSIEIPSSVTKIEKNAFYKCYGLTNIEIQGNVSYLGEGAFNYCKNLETVTISSNVETICDEVFAECGKLKTVTFQWTLDVLRTKANDLTNDHWFKNTSKELVINYNGGSFKPYHSPVEASCTEAGNVEYWEEILTNKTYKNSSYGTEITDVVVPVTTHTFGTWNEGTDATCTEDGVKPHKDCTVCGKHFDENDLEITNIVIEAGHDFNTDSWAADITGHYHSCNREGCTEKLDFGVHNFENGICDTCDAHNTFGTEGLTYTYNSETKTYSVLAYNGEELDVVIPYFYNDGTNGEHKVTEIGAGAFSNGDFWYGKYANNNNITSIIIPDSITTIAKYAFKKCAQITNVVIPNSVINIGLEAFNNCSNLETFTISQNLEVTGEYIFNGTAWYSNQPDGLLYIDKYLYGYKGTVTEEEIVIKEGTIGIFSYAFAYKKNIKSVIFPSKLSWIGSFAFYQCNDLATVNLPANISKIDSSAFAYINYLEEIIVNDPNTEYGRSIFSNAGTKIDEETVLKITLPEGMKKISGSMFYGSALTTINIPSTVTEICDQAFRSCERLTSFVIDDQITHIGEMAFANCDNLSSVTIPEGVQVISDEVFFLCPKLLSLTLPWTLEEIRTKAENVETNHWFTSMDNEFVVYYDGGSFKPYHPLVEQLCSTDGTVEYWEEILTGKTYKNKGYSTEITDIVIPAGCKGGTATCEDKAICEICGNEYGEPLGHNTGYWQEDETGHWKVCKRTDCGKRVEFGEHTYVDGICTTCKGEDIYGTEGLVFSAGSVESYTGTSTTVKIPYFHYNEFRTKFKITKIGVNAFKDNTTIETVILYDIVTTIERDAFTNCTNLKNISLENITEYGYTPFDGCTSLKNVTLSNQLKTISWGLFRNCTGLEEIIIPSSVTTIEFYAFKGCTGLEEINILSGVTKIKDSAFEDCSNVKKVIMPTTITEIGYSAFYNCTAITGLYISDLGSWASVTCSGNTSNPLYYAQHLYLNDVLVTEIVLPEGQTRVGSNTFVNCIDLTNVIIPNTVTYVGNSPFKGCYNIESMTTPISGKTAYDKPVPFAFYFGKDEFENSVLVDFDKGFSTISDSDYYLPIALKTVHINGSEITNSAFRNHNTLETITFDNVTSIGETAFGRCYRLTSVSLPETLTTIGTDAFVSCYKLAEIRNNSSIELTIGSSENGGVSRYAIGIITGDEPSKIAKDENGFITHTDGSELTIVDYRGDNRIITLPEGTTRIHRNCFESSNIISVTFSSSLKSIGTSAFEKCYYLKEVVVNDELETIEQYAFYSCENLMSFTLPATIKTIEDSAFSGNKKLIEVINLSSFDVVAGVYGNGIGGVSYYAKNVVTNPDNAKLSKDENGFVVYTDGEEKILVGYLGSETEITIPDGITSIYKYAFSYNDFITKVVIPETVTSIGDYAFYMATKLESINLTENLLYLGENSFSKATSLKSIVIPASIGTISEYAFYGCSSLTDVTISDGITFIGRSAFYECISLTEITIPSSVKTIDSVAFAGCALTTVVIPEGVETIKNSSFGATSRYANSIITVYIPVSLTTIEGSPFTNSTKEVIYAGTKEQFLEIEFSDYWYHNMGDDLVIKCTDSEMTKAEYNTLFIELMKEKEQQ